MPYEFSHLLDKQEYIHNRSPELRHYGGKVQLPDEFIQKGYCLIEGIESTDEAIELLYEHTAALKASGVGFNYLFQNDARLCKADAIPVCHDSIIKGCQALHFDMGLPLVPKADTEQALMLLIGLYHPMNWPASNAKTRCLSLRGLLPFSTEKLAQKAEWLKEYVVKYGDGPKEYNNFRLQLFARYLDALAGYQDLVPERDARMAEWFQVEDDPTGLRTVGNEAEFYKHHKIDLAAREEQFNIRPGQMLIIDNTRVAHGRVGKRREAEIYQFMLGIKHCPAEQIERYRTDLVQYLCGHRGPQP